MTSKEKEHYDKGNSAKSEALKRKQSQKGTKHLKVHPIHYGEKKEE